MTLYNDMFHVKHNDNFFLNYYYYYVFYFAASGVNITEPTSTTVYGKCPNNSSSRHNFYFVSNFVKYLLYKVNQLKIDVKTYAVPMSSRAC